MKGVITRQEALLRQAIEQQNGRLFKTLGDACFAVFSNAADAVAASLNAQLALCDEEWSLSQPVRIRMALHAGIAEERDNDYFGPPLNRTARLLAIAHGGQILLSGVIKEQISETVPALASLRPMGWHRLKDLQQKEEVFQLDHPTLLKDFPPLQSLSNAALPNNLPLQVTSVIGRERESEEVKNLFVRTRLLTLTGSGGCGKTRLALQVAADMLEQFPDGVWFVDFAPLSESDLIPQTVANMLGIKEEAGKPITQVLTDWMKSKRLLLLLDNCEHLLEGCVSLVSRLLRGCPDVKVLATSQEPLNTSGEQTYRVPSLSLPSLDTQALGNLAATPPFPIRYRDGVPLTAQNLVQYEAVRLFVERARQSLPDFDLTDANAPAIASICVRLDGIPLAIELAAARVSALSIEEIAERFDDRFRLLTGDGNAVLPRQQTLRAAIDWSYDLLDSQERTLLRRLPVFVAGWTLKAAESVCALPPDLVSDIEGEESLEEWEVLEVLLSLVDKSLAIAEEIEGQMHYRLLESVREYARERLNEEQEEEPLLRQRHAAYYVQYFQQQREFLRTAQEAEALRLLEQESGNFRGALEWACQQNDPFVKGEMALGLSLILEYRGLPAAAMQALQPGLEAATHAPAMRSVLRARLLLQRAGLYLDLGNNVEAFADAEAAKSLYQEARDGTGESRANNLLGQAAMDTKDFALARALFTQAMDYLETTDDVYRAVVHNNLALVERRDPEGDQALAAYHLQEALVRQRKQGDRRGMAESLLNLGVLAHIQEKLEVANEYYMEALEIEQTLGDRFGVGRALNNLGEIAEAHGDIRRACRYYAASERLLEEAQSSWLGYATERLVSATESIGYNENVREELRREARLTELNRLAEWASGD